MSVVKKQLTHHLFFYKVIGIVGKEGRQAVRASDYAFGRFRFVQRALLVHGHYFYLRIAILVQYFFYKVILWMISQLTIFSFNYFPIYFFTNTLGCMHCN